MTRRFVARPAYDRPQRLFVEVKPSNRYYIASRASSERIRRLAKCHPYRVIIHDRNK